MIDIMKFIFIFAVILFEVVEIIKAFRINTLMDNKVFAFFLKNQGIASVWIA